MEWTAKIDILGSAKNLPQGGPPTAIPAQRVAVGSEEKARPVYEKSPKAFFIALGLFLSWSEWGDSNSRHLAPKASALPTALHPVMKFSNCGQIWGQRRFLTSFSNEKYPASDSVPAG